MDNSTLAAELMDKLHMLRKAQPQKYIDEALHGEFYVLQFLAMRGEEVLPGELCHEMDVSSARIAQTLNSIERKGWITRRIDPQDRRRIIITLTAAGKTEAERLRRAVTGIAAKMLDLLGERDATEYVRITGKLADAISKCPDII